MPTSETCVPTTSGERYLTQLCKHWSQRFEVTLVNAESGFLKSAG